MYKRILVPTDGSELSEQATAAAIELARLCGAEIVAFSVAEPYPVMPAADGTMLIEPGPDPYLLEQAALQNVDKVAEAASKAGVRAITVTAMSMVPHDEIIRAANEHQCDLIFMASHGRRGFSKLIAGSVTQNVLTHSTIPVMVLRPGAKDRMLHAPGSPAASAS